MIRDKWKVTVDPEEGDRRIPSRCAIAEALKHEYGSDISYVQVTQNHIAFTLPASQTRLYWRTRKGSRVRDWVARWDALTPDMEPLGLILKLEEAKIVRSEDRKWDRYPSQQPEAKAKSNSRLARRYKANPQSRKSAERPLLTDESSQ